MKEVKESALKNFGRRQSDTDLQRIDREKTFGVNALMQPAELLAKVVTALGSIRQNEDMDDASSLGYITANTGVNCFSDSEILDTERCSTWSLGIGSELSCNTTPVKSRKRAASDINIPMRDHNGVCIKTWLIGSPERKSLEIDSVSQNRLNDATKIM